MGCTIICNESLLPIDYTSNILYVSKVFYGSNNDGLLGELELLGLALDEHSEFVEYHGKKYRVSSVLDNARLQSLMELVNKSMCNVHVRSMVHNGLQNTITRCTNMCSGQFKTGRYDFPKLRILKDCNDYQVASFRSSSVMLDLIILKDAVRAKRLGMEDFHFVNNYTGKETWYNVTDVLDYDRCKVLYKIYKEVIQSKETMCEQAKKLLGILDNCNISVAVADLTPLWDYLKDKFGDEQHDTFQDALRQMSGK